MTVLERYGIAGDSASSLAQSVEAGLRHGRLQAGQPLPTVRALAAALGLSPATVAAAYAGLRARGLVSTGGRRGTRLAPRPPVALPAAVPEPPAHLANLADGNPDPALLPDLAACLRRLKRGRSLYGEPQKHPGLARLAARELEADGVPAAHLAVVSGAMDGVERVLLAHLRPGDRVAVEDPGYPAVLDLVAALGLLPEPVAVDDAGARPESLARALRRGARAAVLTPRAQNPAGGAWDAARLKALRQTLAAQPDLLVIEDDHAGPVAGAAALTLAPRARWAVVRSVSKSLGPDLRVALLAGDAETVARVEGRQALGCGWVSHLLQAAVADLLGSAATRRQLAAAARAYAQRREALLSALARHGLAAHGRSGLNVWLPVPAEAGLVAALATRGWAVRAGERYRLASPPALRLTVSRLRPAQAPRLAEDLAALLRPAAGGGTARG